MWSSDKFGLLPRLAVVVLAASLLGGCFRPLYGVSASGVSIQDQLAAIEVATINPGSRDNARLAYYTQTELTYRMNGGSPEEVDKQFRLEVTVTESVASTIINTSTGNAEAALLTGKAGFKLVPIGGGKAIYESQAIASSAYDRTPQRFAALRAARDAQIRVSKALADQIHTRIAAKFASGR
ncbi:LPS assembly lipoprotein LptE [Pseudochelatococcus sp. G4_1912]|uniref:LPS assembly lipoprotein LptE n=1 Tax=Pseudochelatococcus sp. G4_1912 TaxID=3114288 RepID=UPI0039C6FF1F